MTLSTQLDYEVVDVFADRPFTGNPLAVVLDGDELSTESMQSIAREFNLSETTFPVRTETSGADYRLRIFTPAAELPFAGHPSVGTAWLLAQLGRVAPGRVVQECGAGLLPIEVSADAATLTGGAATWSDPLDAGPLLAAVGLDEQDVDVIAPPRSVGAGLTQVHLPVRAEAVARAVPDYDRIEAAHADRAMYLLAWDPDRRAAHVRMFAPGLGAREDPATGSAALGLGVWLGVSDLVPDDSTTAYTVRQGAEIGRPSRLECTVTRAHGEVVRNTVTGGAHRVASGRIAVP